MNNSSLTSVKNANTSPGITSLSALQTSFGLFRSGGDFYVIDLQQVTNVKAGKGGRVEFYKKQPGELLLKRFLEDQSIPSKPKEVIADFWINPNTTVFTEIAFSPLPTPPSTLNYWIDPTAQPISGNCNIINLFLQRVICSNSQHLYLYLKSYLSHMLQRPEEKPGVMLVLLGGQGTGKGTFFRLLRSIWGHTTLQVSDIDEIIGQFNASLENNYVICMDEALFSGDKKAQDRLKSLITEPQCRIEQKYQPSVTIDSFHRIFAASNHDHFANVEQDDRRFLFLRVSDEVKCDHAYFANLSSALADPKVINAFVNELMAIDISKFNVRKKPPTDEHDAQKLRSLNGFARYWFEVLTTGNLDVRELLDTKWNEPLFVPTSSLLSSFIKFDKKAEWYRSIQENQLSAELKRLCPSVKSDRQQHKVNGQKRGWLLPSIKVARKEFEKILGCSINWADEIEINIGFDKQILDTYWSDLDSNSKSSKTLENILDAWDDD